MSEPRKRIDTAIGSVAVVPECKVQATCTNGSKCWEAGECLRAPCEANGYKGARRLRDTPYATVTEWRQATIAAIPEADRCPACKGSGADVILASNGGVGEVVNCWPCDGTGRRRGIRRRSQEDRP